MVCRACGREERASEGYPCDGCGTFICLMCNLRGVLLCSGCSAGQAPPPAGGGRGDGSEGGSGSGRGST